MASLPGLRREDAPAAAAADGIAGVSAVLPQMQARERDQRKKFSDRNRLSARRKDAVLTYLSGRCGVIFLKRGF